MERLPMTPHSLDILYRDEHILVILKPAWLVVHRGLARDKVTVIDILRQQLEVGTVFPVHRLDRQTSGVLLFALNSDIASEMQQQFQTGQVQKEYIALVRGIPKNTEGTIDSPVPKCEDGERVDAITTYRVLESKEIQPRAVSLVCAKPMTGRFHQIRRHLKHINHPIIGDANYGKGKLNREFKEIYGLNRMALHAMSLQLVHPLTQAPVTVRAPLPEDLKTPLVNMGFPQGVRNVVRCISADRLKIL